MKTASSKHTEPVRLLRNGGRWCLEYTRLVTVDDQLLRPERRRVFAGTELLRSLREQCPPERLAEAVALMGQADDGSEVTFELAADGWAEAPARPPSRHPRARHELEATLADTKAQLVLLRGLYDTLLKRVVALESTTSQTLRSVPPRLGRRVPSRRSVFDELTHGSRVATAVATALSPNDAKPSLPVPPAPPPRAAVAAATADETQVSPGASALSLPSQTDFVACLEMLAADVTVTPIRTQPSSAFEEFHVTLLSDEAGEAIAALLFNQRAAAEFGAGILGVAPPERDQQARDGLSADSLDGLNEIANNLTGLLNRANPKHQVRLGALGRGAAGLPTWLGKPAKKLGFSTRESGELFLLVR